MNTKLVLFGSMIGSVVLGSAGAARAAALVDPAFFGQANTTYQEWDGFTSPAGPNPATHVANAAGTPNWLDTTAATDGAFAIGSAPTAHIYSFSGVLHPEVDVPAPALGSGAVTTIVLQAEALGNPLDTTQFAVSYPGLSGSGVLPTSVTETDLGLSGSGFGGGDFYYLVMWTGLPSAASYAVTYAAIDTSSSQLSARVDTLTAVPEPAMFALVLPAGATAMLRRRRAGRA